MLNTQILVGTCDLGKEPEPNNIKHVISYQAIYIFFSAILTVWCEMYKDKLAICEKLKQSIQCEKEEQNIVCHRLLVNIYHYLCTA